MSNPQKFINWGFWFLQGLSGLLILLKFADGWGLSSMSWLVAVSPTIFSLFALHIIITIRLYVGYTTLIDVVGIIFDDYQQRTAPLNPEYLFESDDAATINQ